MDKEILSDKIKLIESKISSLTELLENSDKDEKLPFKIISIFRPSDRIEEYIKDNETLPRLSNGSIDYWELAQRLCTKDGGRLPTMEELAQLASYIYGQDIGENEDNYNVEVKNHIDGLDPSESYFRLWSSSLDGSEHAYYRGFYSSYTGYNDSNRNYDNRRVVCLGDE